MILERCLSGPISWGTRVMRYTEMSPSEGSDGGPGRRNRPAGGDSPVAARHRLGLGALGEVRCRADPSLGIPDEPHSFRHRRRLHPPESLIQIALHSLLPFTTPATSLLTAREGPAPLQMEFIPTQGAASRKTIRRRRRCNGRKKFFPWPSPTSIS